MPGDKFSGMAPRGRRRGPSTTRAEILDAARSLFGTYGYDRTSLRMIAQEARVDPALVARAFDGKHGLFLAAVQWPWDPADVLPAVAAGPKRDAGRRIAKLFIDTAEDPEQRAPILALLASTTASESARTLFRDFLSTQVFIPLVRGCGFDQPELRGALIGAQNVGLAMARHVLGIEPLASLDAASLVDIIGDSTQRILTARLPSASDGPTAPGADSRGGGDQDAAG
jgi:AcrR family transcriptional regulator